MIMIAFLTGNAQCLIKQNEKQSGYITYYLDPELVAQTESMGIAMSVQMVAEKYFLSVTYQFAKSKAEPVEEKLAVNLKNGYSLELEMYSMDVVNAAGVELCIGIFKLEDAQIKYFKESPLVSIDFRLKSSDKKIQIPITESNNILIRHLKCFGK